MSLREQDREWNLIARFDLKKIEGDCGLSAGTQGPYMIRFIDNFGVLSAALYHLEDIPPPPSKKEWKPRNQTLPW